jgi:hypothetical protein
VLGYQRAGEWGTLRWRPPFNTTSLLFGTFDASEVGLLSGITP